MTCANNSLRNRFAVLVLVVMTAGPGIVRADKEPFTYGTGNLMVVVEWDNKSILVIDGTDLEVIKQIKVGAAAVHPEFTARGAYLFVSSWGDNKVVVYDGFTYEKIKEIPAITPTSVLSSRRGDEHGV